MKGERRHGALPIYSSIPGAGLTPEVMVRSPHILHGKYRCEHGVVLIVIPVESVAADRLQVLNGGQEFPDHLQLITIFAP